MIKKTLLLFPVLLGLLFFGIAGKASADAIWSQVDIAKSNIALGKTGAAQAAVDKLLADFSGNEHIAQAVCEIAHSYRSSKEYEQANKLYQYVVDNWPDAEHAMWSQMGVVLSNIGLGNDANAQQAIDKLLADFSENEHIAQAVHEIAGHYRWLKKYEKSKQLCQYVVDNWPSSESAMWSQMGVAMANIALGEPNAATAAIDKLVADFSGNEHIAQAVHEIAGHCNFLKKHEKARELHQYVVENWPGSEQAMWSQMGVAMANISLGKPEAAQAALDKLLADFSGNEQIAQAVHEIAGHCNFLKKHEKARELHQYVLDNWPGSEQAIWSQMGVAVSNAALGKTGAAQAAVDKLLTDFSKNKHIADAVRQVANAHRKSGKYEKANELYQYVIDNWPGGESAVLARMDMALSNVSSLIHDGNDSEALTALDKLLTEFSGHPALPKAISYIEEEYYNKILAAEPALSEDYLNAVEIWEKVINAVPDFFHDDPDLYYFIGDCYRQLGEYENAIACYQKVVDNWPDCQFAWNAPFMIRYCLEQLEKSTGNHR